MKATTSRLHIRDFEESDWQAVHAFRSDPEVARYMDFEPETEAETRQWLEEVIFHNRQEPRVAHNCAIVLKETNQVIGWIGIGRPRNPGLGDYDFGYCLQRGLWGQGYMTEAVKALLAFGFRELGAKSIFAECDVANIASARVMEKAGMQQVARFQKVDQVSGEKEEGYRYLIYDYEWRAQQLFEEER